MNLDVTTVNLIFIGIPGAICYFVLGKLIGKVGKSTLETVIWIFIYSIGAYVIYAYLGRAFDRFGISNAAAELIIASPATMKIRTIDVGGASLCSIPLAAVVALGYRHNIVNRLGQKLRLSNRIADEDVWHLFHNRAPDVSWMVVRDHKLGLQYFGAVSHFSESGDDRELLMNDVSVYRNDSGSKIYDCNVLYMCRNKFDFTIEIHPTGEGGTQ